MLNDLTVLLLAGGKSSRFWPLPNKLTQPFAGKTFLEHQLTLLQSVGLNNIIVVTAKEIAGRIGGTNIKVVIQNGEGQGAAILSAEKDIQGKRMLVLNADDLIDKSLLENTNYYASEKVNLLPGYKVKHYFSGGYLVLDGKKIFKIMEKPGEGNEPSEFIKLVCDYFYSADKLLAYLKETPNSDPNRHYETALSKMMDDGEVFEMVEYEGTWLPLKYPWQTLNVMQYNLSIIDKTNISKSAKIHPSAEISGPAVISDEVRILEFAKIAGPCYIGAGTIVGNHTLIRNSMIGENSVIGFGSEITRSYIGSNSWFHTNYIGDSVISDNVGFGAGAVTANLRLDEKEVHSVVKEELVNVRLGKLGAIIGEGTRIGVEAAIMPGVKIGKNSVIGPGVQLYEDLADDKRCFIKQELIISENKQVNLQSRDKYRKKI